MGTVTLVRDTKVEVEVRWDANGLVNHYCAGNRRDLKKVGDYPAVGSRVEPGPNWHWGDQNHGGKGTVIGSPDSESYLPVRWDQGNKYRYQWGAGKLDLQVVIGSTAAGGSNEVVAERAQQRSARDGERACPNNHVLQPFITPTPSYTCDVCGARQPLSAKMASCRTCNYDVCALCYTSGKLALATGTRVVRGVNWRWGDQDGGAESEGVVLGPAPLQARSDGVTTMGWYSIHWPRTGVKNIFPYKIGDMGLAEIDRPPQRGSKVIRGPQWRWGNQDGGEGKTGTCMGQADKAGWYKVTWDMNGFENSLVSHIWCLKIDPAKDD